MQKLIEFESGMKLALVRNRAVRSVAIGVFVGAGVIRETEDIKGISHFIEHMVFKGTRTRSSFDIVNEIDSVGAQINAYTAKCYTCYHTVSLDESAEKCAEILSDLYFEPTFDSEELDKERRVVIEEINESEDTPDDVCLEELLGAFYKGHPLAKPILGTKKSLKSMTSDTLREYHNRFYIPSNTVLSMAGNISEEDAVRIAKKYFDDRFASSSVTLEEAACARANSLYVKRKKHIEQAHIAFAFPGYAYDDPKAIGMQLMASIFSLDMSSRLFQSVREKLGLCYTIVGYPSSYQNNGVFTVYVSTSPENAVRATKAIREEIDLLLRDGVSSKELEKGKLQMKTSLVLGQESTSQMMRAFGTHALQTGKLYGIDERISAIDSATQEDVLEAAHHVFDFSRVCASVVSPVELPNILDVIKGQN